MIFIQDGISAPSGGNIHRLCNLSRGSQVHPGHLIVICTLELNQAKNDFLFVISLLPCLDGLMVVAAFFVSLGQSPATI